MNSQGTAISLGVVVWDCEFSVLGFQLKEEKNSSSRTDKEELKLTNQRLDLLSSEHERVLNSLNAEKQATAQLQVGHVAVFCCSQNVALPNSLICIVTLCCCVLCGYSQNVALPNSLIHVVTLCCCVLRGCCLTLAS